MEFIIVLPIYFTLIGFAFVIGELSLHSVHLVSSADRGMALTHNRDEIDAAGFKPMDTDTFIDRLLEVISFDRERKKVDYSYSGDSAGGSGVEVSDFDHPQHIDAVPSGGHYTDSYWTKAVAGKIKDNYTLTPLSRGFIAHWYYQTERQVYDGDLMSETLERPEDGAVDKILKKGTIGRAEMHGNYMLDAGGNQVRNFGYYCLQRTLASFWNGDDATVPYRAWDSSRLVEEEDSGEGPRVWERLKDDKDGGESFASVELDGEFIKTGASSIPCLRGNRRGVPAEAYDFPDLL